MMSARNMIWILTFCQGLQEAILAFDISHADFLFLQEHSEAFKGKSSVKKLALAPSMSAQIDSRLQWGVGSDRTVELKAGTKESQALFDLLSVTRELLCLELFPISTQRRLAAMSEIPKSNFSLDCLSGLELSFSTLKHIRVAGFKMEEHPRLAMEFSKFRALKVLGMDFETIMTICNLDPPSTILPSVETVHLMHYPQRFFSPQMDDVEGYALSALFESQSFPSLQQLAIPSAPINANNEVLHSAEVMELWKVARSNLEENDEFKSGKIKLRLLGQGDTGE